MYFLRMAEAHERTVAPAGDGRWEQARICSITRDTTRSVCQVWESARRRPGGNEKPAASTIND